jgi:hypothetical protein
VVAGKGRDVGNPGTLRDDKGKGNGSIQSGCRTKACFITQGDETRSMSEATLLWKRHPHLCHLDRSEAQRRDLCVEAPSWKYFFDRTRLSVKKAGV